MKTLKSLFLLCAGLSFCACSSDNEPQFPEGEGVVKVRIVAPQTRAEQAASGDNDILVTGTYSVILVDSKGTHETTVQGTGTATFDNVAYPKSVTVKLEHNNGASSKASYELSDLASLQVLPANIPVYGYTESFGTPTDGQNNKKVYTVSVNVAIPVARLEVGPITWGQEGSVFSTLTASGVYLDNLRNAGSSYSSGLFTDVSAEMKNYIFAEGCGTGEVYNANGQYGLGDAVNSVSLLAQDAKLPATADVVYAYNFYGATPTDTPLTGDALTTACAKNPQFKIYFSASKTAEDAEATKRYAMIAKYQDAQGNDIVLENGKIYKITSAILMDKNIVIDEENNVAYQVAVTVKEASWKPVVTTGVWAE